MCPCSVEKSLFYALSLMSQRGTAERAAARRDDQLMKGRCGSEGDRVVSGQIKRVQQVEDVCRYGSEDVREKVPDVIIVHRGERDEETEKEVRRVRRRRGSIKANSRGSG
ncbi:Hypothetical predicted protein [Xyrichtys novacula]|uniref:Uncharacterized protein n=1 Tax=Xyrichtys novacula TaxID=13765 RepID=A0AAV1GLX0_XYRNO|nr:Hypothetical predicted protein [Xyrichtys novacula]